MMYGFLWLMMFLIDIVMKGVIYGLRVKRESRGR